MTCKWDHEYIWQCLLIAFNAVREGIGDDGIALAIITISSIGLTLFFHWMQGLLMPVVRKQIKDLINRGMDWFEQGYLFKFGIRVKTCVVALILAAVLYPMLKILVRFP